MIKSRTAMQLAAAAMVAGSVSMALDYNNPAYLSGVGTKTVQYSDMVGWKTSMGSVSGSGDSFTVTTNGAAWDETGAYYAFVLPAGYTVSLTGAGKVTTNLNNNGGLNSTYCDVVLFGMTGVGTGVGSAIAGKTAGPSASGMAYMTQTQYKSGPVPTPTAGGTGGYRGAKTKWGEVENPSGLNASTGIARGDGFDYVDDGTYASYFDAVMNYGANASNFTVAGTDVAGGVYAGVTWNADNRYLQLQMSNVTNVDLSTVLYDGHGLGRALEDQVGTFNGTITNTTGQDMTIIFGLKIGSEYNTPGSATFTGIQYTFIPEPASLGLLALGAMAFLGRRRK